MAIAIFGGGCFWCLEAPLQKVIGVNSVTSGYCGGDSLSANYQQVCSGTTAHAEVVSIDFDENQISYSTLLEVFFHLHDPTQLNRQGNDIGTQYRSVVFYQDDVQKLAALKMKASVATLYANDIVTEISPIMPFYSAESYHQNYYNSNPQQPYCNLLIGPKITKFNSQFAHLLL